MNFKTGDKVVVIAGKEKGKEGKIAKILKADNKVIIEKLNMIKKHMKPKNNNGTGEIIEVEAPIHASNVKLLASEPKAKPSKTTSTKEKETKVKATKKTNEKNK